MTPDDSGRERLRRSRRSFIKRTEAEFVEVPTCISVIEVYTAHAPGAEELLREWPAEDELAKRRLRRLLKRILTDRQLQALWLYYFADKRLSEIARALQIKKSTAHQTIFGRVRKGKRIGGALRRIWRKLKSKVPNNPL